MQSKNLVCDLSSGMCGEESSEAAVEKINVPSTQKKVQVLYFTDPICSACWALEPVMKRLVEEYGHYFTLEHRMGGLLKSWEGFRDAGNGISKPADVAHHWDEIGEWSGMPIDGDVWLEDPLESSYPPSIAYKAAQLQGDRLADLFLRRIREMVFLEKKNISKREYLLQAAADVGLDRSRFSQSLDERGTILSFENDMELAKELRIRGFPTLVFRNENGSGLIVRGVSSYESYVSALEQLTESPLNRKKNNYSAKDIVEKYHFVSTREVAELIESSIPEALRQLEELADSESIEKVKIRDGYFWRKVV